MKTPKQKQYYRVILQQDGFLTRTTKETAETAYNSKIIILPLIGTGKDNKTTILIDTIKTKKETIIVTKTLNQKTENRAYYQEFVLNPKTTAHQYHSWVCFSSVELAKTYSEKLQKQAIQRRKSYLTNKAKNYQKLADEYYLEAIAHASRRVPSIEVREIDEDYI